MRLQQRWMILGLAVAAAFTLLAAQSIAVTVATEDFDGGDLNLISSSVTNLDGGGGDWFGVGAISAWPQVDGVPFSLTDDSVYDVSTQGANPPFTGDLEGVFGQFSDFDNAFFGLSDTREWTPEELTATWTFDVSGFTDLELSVDLGGQADGASFDGFNPETAVSFTYQIDGGPVGTAFSILPNPGFGSFTYRAMDDGDVPTVGANGPLEATGDNPVSKVLSDTGLDATDTFLNKTPASDAGAGLMDTFTTALNGTGSQLTLTMTANVPFEAMAFDTITINGIPEPGSIVLFGLGAVGLLAGRRSARRLTGMTTACFAAETSTAGP